MVSWATPARAVPWLLRAWPGRSRYLDRGARPALVAEHVVGATRVHRCGSLPVAGSRWSITRAPSSALIGGESGGRAIPPAGGAPASARRHVRRRRALGDMVRARAASQWPGTWCRTAPARTMLALRSSVGFTSLRRIELRPGSPGLSAERLGAGSPRHATASIRPRGHRSGSISAFTRRFRRWSTRQATRAADLERGRFVRTRVGDELPRAQPTSTSCERATRTSRRSNPNRGRRGPTPPRRAAHHHRHLDRAHYHRRRRDASAE